MSRKCLLCSVLTSNYVSFSEKRGEKPSPREILENFTRIDTNFRIPSDSKICKVCRATLEIIYDFTLSCEKALELLDSIEMATKDEEEEPEVKEELGSCDPLPESTFDDLEIKEQMDEEYLDEAEPIEVTPKIEQLDKPFSCPVCGKSFKILSLLNNHLVLHDSERPFTCQCGKSFKTKVYLKKHIRGVHDESAAKCPLCDLVLKNQVALDNHLKLKHRQPDHDSSDVPREKPHKCGHCEASFAQKCLLRNHERVHSDLRPFLCPTCGRSYKSESHLKQHLKSHLNPPKIVCKVCSKEFSDRDEYLVHVETHPKPEYVCDYCGKKFAQKASLTQHTYTHFQSSDGLPYTCEICSKSFRVPSALQEHSKMHTDETRKHHCEYCPTSFKRADHLRIHVAAIHLKHKPFKCEICSLCFVQEAILRAHIKNHSEVKQFVCDFCSKPFRYKTELKAHVRSHTGERDFKCSFCSRTFGSTKSLARHARKFHSSLEHIEYITE